ncbi:MAG: molybdopterin-dependent oxidoreductase [Acidobacteriota bacterium]
MGASFGRGASTNHYVDFKNSRCFLIEGNNTAENHPMAMPWIMEAKLRGAKVIHVDPRFTRTSAVADIYAQIRPGSDIAFLGAMINYIINERHYDEQYLKDFTNAAFLVNPDYQFTDGLFCGFDETRQSYDINRWAYQLDEHGRPHVAENFTDEHTVFSHLKAHFAEYSFEKAEKVTGIPAAQQRLIAQTFVNNRPGVILYALGATQHTYGTQHIRCYPIIQLLLGNLGKPGGGVAANRGESNVQGATDLGVAWDKLPGYLTSPSVDTPDLKSWTVKNGSLRAKYLINFLKAIYGDEAQPENDFCYQWLPKLSSKINYSAFKMFEAMAAEKIRLLINIGQNPAVSNANHAVTLKGLASLELLVVVDIFETETASFWKDGPFKAKDVQTEVLLLPAACFLEKSGCITHSGRWLQWRDQCVDAPGEAKSDLWILDQLFKRVRTLYANSQDPKDAPILNAVWDYGDEPDYLRVLEEISGRVWADQECLVAGEQITLTRGTPVANVSRLQMNGSTSSGCWLYCGAVGIEDSQIVNYTARRDPSDPSGLGLHTEWAWSWPANIRILYNRASCDLQGQPRADVKPLIWWDEATARWQGEDIPDVVDPFAPPDTSSGRNAFAMLAEGRARLFAAPYADLDSNTGEIRDKSPVLVDGPLPVYYEPIESPTVNIYHPRVQNNPVVKYKGTRPATLAEASKDYPYVLCTGFIHEMWGGGAMTRRMPKLVELIPEPFVEMSRQLAERLKIKPGDRVRLITTRGEAVARTIVTGRIKTLTINGKPVETLWAPMHWGALGLSCGNAINAVTIDALEPNVQIAENKACLCNVQKL